MCSANLHLVFRSPKAVSDVPEAPTNVHGAQEGLRAVAVSWEAPEDNNSTITMYKVTYNSTGAHGGVVTATGSPPPTSTNITGLATGLGYTFAVRAINAVGAGAQSERSAEVRSPSCIVVCTG
ncbi:unnamed protein product, partial [Ectocarpus sp. 13 AM-2016]